MELYEQLLDDPDGFLKENLTDYDEFQKASKTFHALRAKIWSEAEDLHSNIGEKIDELDYETNKELYSNLEDANYEWWSSLCSELGYGRSGDHIWDSSMC